LSERTSASTRLCESAVEVGKEVIEASKNEPRWRPVAKQMVHAWNGRHGVVA